jgi:hypothetical protein
MWRTAPRAYILSVSIKEIIATEARSHRDRREMKRKGEKAALYKGDLPVLSFLLLCASVSLWLFILTKTN